MPNPFLARYYFRHGAVHASDDRIARYVVCLSLALNDIRIAGRYATRRRQNSAERLYFVRLLASHLRELVLLIDTPNSAVVPSVEEFIASLPRGTKPSRTDIRRSHSRVLRLLQKPMATGRPDVATRSGTRRPNLRDDLKELRNRSFHYGYDQLGADAVEAAMASLAGKATGYAIRERTMRALYADDVAVKLAHPFEAEFACDMHSRVAELLGRVAHYVQQVEAAWI
jgi:hypothetical protein